MNILARFHVFLQAAFENVAFAANFAFEPSITCEVVILNAFKLSFAPQYLLTEEL